MMRVLSPIYPADVKPVRDGWYLTQFPGTGLWQKCFWENGCWRGEPGAHAMANRAWVGLAFDPAGAFLSWQDTDEMAGRRMCERGVFVPGAQCC